MLYRGSNSNSSSSSNYSSSSSSSSKSTAAAASSSKSGKAEQVQAVEDVATTVMPAEVTAFLGRMQSLMTEGLITYGLDFEPSYMRCIAVALLRVDEIGCAARSSAAAGLFFSYIIACSAVLSHLCTMTKRMYMQ
jgi:hypothetical protein